MTQAQPPNSQHQLAYMSVTNPYRNAPTLVLLAVIFNYVMAGIDLLYGLSCLGFAIFMYFTITSTTVTSGSGIPPERWIALLYAGPAIPSLAVATIKIIAATKMRRRSRHAFGWGLAAGIVGCIQIWCGVLCMPACIIPLGVGIYTIVIVCLDYVRAYLADRPQDLHAFSV